MQKLITITIDVEKLQSASNGAFTLSEIEEVNSLLEEGWAIEEWEFITGEQETAKAVLFVVLNDDSFDTDIYGTERDSKEDEEDEAAYNEDEHNIKSEIKDANEDEEEESEYASTRL